MTNPTLQIISTRTLTVGRLRRILMASASAALMVLASASGAKLRAAPVGGVVASGTATISTTGNTTTISQTTDRAAIDWTSFNLAAS
ncbi:MAG: hypothetical protein ORO03_06595 [Alphaproteobacteria bacterium]|nr:hypothetical protein [Alphaproteobacteria bacterium]